MRSEAWIGSEKIDHGEDKPREECGVYGIYAPGQQVASLTYLGLQVLQHRGQEGAGIAVSSGDYIMAVKDVGLVHQALRGGESLKGLPDGHIATGHVRYGTHIGNSLDDSFRAVQPMIGKSEKTGIEFTVSHNGHILNFDELSQKLPHNGGYATDSELITRLIANELDRDSCPDLPTAITAAVSRLKGAYSLVVMSKDSLLGIRDPHGFRPLVLGELPGSGWVIASETGALDITKAEFKREVEPGEIVEINDTGLNSFHPFERVDPALCAFEFVYFSRPDAVMEGENVARTRIRMGKQLAVECPVEADIVIGAPYSGSLAAKGFSDESGIELVEEGLVKNRYVGRSFIVAGQLNRENAVRMKLNANRSFIEGKRTVLIDDSIVRGTTTTEIVKMLRNAGASEVHLRISSAPYRWPCFYGMDTGDPSKLIAVQHEAINQICQELGADSLEYLSTEGLRLAIGPLAGHKICLACMTGKYPTEVPRDSGVLK
ncbi:MAG: amidophosphoribosyltransferase [Candidatus Saccharimonadales bacterium]